MQEYLLGTMGQVWHTVVGALECPTALKVDSFMYDILIHLVGPGMLKFKGRQN